MELDELKLHLMQKIDNDRGLKSPSDIAELLSKKTKSVITKLKNSLLFEIVSCVVFLIAFVYFIATVKYSSIKIYLTAFLILIILFLIILFYLYKKVNELSTTNLPIKNNLIALHKLLKEYTKRYFQFTMSLIPICLIFSGYLGYIDGKNGVVIDELEPISSNLKTGKELIIFLVAYIGILIVTTYLFTKWYLKKLYGKYLDQLQHCINELD